MLTVLGAPLSNSILPVVYAEESAGEQVEIDARQESRDENAAGREEATSEETEISPESTEAYSAAEHNAVYDTQPSSLQDVQDAIDAYNSAYQEALSTGGFTAAIEVAKPRWEFAVEAEYMPLGYDCGLVSVIDDPDFGADYYTFFAKVQMAAMTGIGTQTDPYIIYTGEDLYNFAGYVNAGNTSYSNAYVELGGNVDISAYNWPGIGRYGSTTSNQRVFSGHFDGKGYTISGLRGAQTYGDANRGYGLFGYLNGSTVSNIKVILGGDLVNGTNNGGTTYKNYYIGVIAGWAEGASIINCDVDGQNFLIQSDIEAGGIVGHAENNVIINNCNVMKVKAQARYEVAGIAGRVRNNTKITNCTVDSGTFTVTGGGYAAGLVGIVEGQDAYGLTNYIDNCHTSNITARTSGNYAAGLIGACRYGMVTNSGATNVNAYGAQWHGGAFGVIYDGSKVNSCYAKNMTIASDRTDSWGLGGFAGAIYNDTSASSTVTNCYAVDGTITSSGPYGTGGFVGMMWNTSEVHRSYAQVDVFAGGTTADTSVYSGKGGFVGSARGSSKITNCYSTGSVTASVNNYIGSFAGNLAASGVRVNNAFGTGTVNASFPNRAGGFAGNAAAANMISGSFYDITTTCRSTAISTSGNASQGILGCSTTDMVDIDKFGAWGIKENFLGKAGGKGTDDSPWYIDDDITYPYFYYQFDGYTKAETNYFIASTTYQDKTGLGQKRADFTVKKDSLPLRVLSAGAVKAYMPYSGTSRYNISRGDYTNIPGAAYNSQLYSLGGVSKTNIIAFNGSPYAEKSSDRAVWDVNDTETYTYVGDVVTYYMTAWNYDTESDFKEVTVTDTILDCVTFLPDSVTVNEGESFNPDTAVTIGADGGKPYYSYSKDTGKLTVHLKDMPKINPDTGDISSYTISFKVIVEKDAASHFTSAADYSGDIENQAVLSGELWYTGAASGVDYDYEFSDDNLDPVYDSYLFEFYKVDANNTGKKLKGAGFSLYKYTGSGKPTSVIDPGNLTSDWELCTVTRTSKQTELFSSTDGLVSYFQITDYPNHRYYMLVETAAPNGYLESDCQWLAEVSGDAASITIETIEDSNAKTVNDFTSVMDAGGKEYYQLGNTPGVGSITIEKENESGGKLKGARFLLEKQEGDNWTPLKWDGSAETWTTLPAGETYTGETNTEGQLILGKSGGESTLPFGTYRITEVKSPEGYSLLKEPIVTELPYEKTAESDPEDGWDTKYVNEDGDTVYSYINLNYIVTNIGAFTLPEAGNSGFPWYICAGIAALLAGAASIIIRHRYDKRVRADTLTN